MATLYDTNFYEWTLGQAAILRRLAAERANSELDLANLDEPPTLCPFEADQLLDRSFIPEPPVRYDA